MITSFIASYLKPKLDQSFSSISVAWNKRTDKKRIARVRQLKLLVGSRGKGSASKSTAGYFIFRDACSDFYGNTRGNRVFTKFMQRIYKCSDCLFWPEYSNLFCCFHIATGLFSKQTLIR